MIPATILYYLPGKAAGGFTAAALGSIPERLRGRFATHTRQDSSPGPDGGRGLLITWQENVLVSFDAKAQRWQRCGDHWRGVRNDYQAAEFAKDAPPSEGYPVRLGDGRAWVIPVALADAPNYAIPWREGLDDEGRLVRAVDPAYADVCRVARGLWERMENTGRLQMDDDDLRRACATAIAVNYRLDLDDCLFLGLFSSESYTSIARALLDMPALEEMLSDPKVRAGLSVPSGGPASSATIVPPTPTSPSAAAKDS
jgi:hypothetical protein